MSTFPTTCSGTATRPFREPNHALPSMINPVLIVTGIIGLKLA